MYALIATLLALASAPPKDAFPGKPFSAVRAFVMNEDVTGPPPCLVAVDAKGTLCKSVRGPGRVLTPSQAATLQSTLNAPTSFGEPESKCFIPHHAFVYYDAHGQVVGQAAVCFMCDAVRGEPDVPAQGKDPSKTSLSKDGKAALQSLCRDLGLAHCAGEPPRP